MYKITQYSYDQARRLGVIIKPSTNPKKKIDVFKNGVRVASIGAIGYSDYPTSGFDKIKRRLYRLRHAGEEKRIGSNGFYAWKILW